MLNGLQSIILPYNILLFRNQRSADFPALIYNDTMTRKSFAFIPV